MSLFNVPGDANMPPRLITKGPGCGLLQKKEELSFITKSWCLAPCLARSKCSIMFVNDYMLMIA